jgi:3-phosphoglycerate kinase
MSDKHPVSAWLDNEATKEAAARLYQLEQLDQQVATQAKIQEGLQKEASLEPLSDDQEEALFLEQVRITAMEEEQAKLASGYMTNWATGDDVYVADLFDED